MDYDFLADHLSGKGHVVIARSFQDQPAIVIRCDIGDYQVELVHFEHREFTQLPLFFVANPQQYGQIAHLLFGEGDALGELCVSDSDSISVNYEQPHLALETSLERHIELLGRALLDADWNKQELVREFGANWSFLCDGKLSLCWPQRAAMKRSISTGP